MMKKFGDSKKQNTGIEQRKKIFGKTETNKVDREMTNKKQTTQHL